MEIIESLKIKEKAYIEKLENGLTIIIIPKKNTNKKHIVWGTNFGSIDNHFVDPTTNKEVRIPDGVAHFLEHKMFEQKSGVNSLDKLMSLGVEPNAYTTNDHTAYYYECTDKFYEALDELMDYVQNPYYTDENVEKEKGIIGQEIKMYEDDPSWRLYINGLDCMYHKNEIKLDIAGTVESISKIDKEMLYSCYNTFYNPSNMLIVACGNFKPEELLKDIKERLIEKKDQGKIERIYEKEDETINKKYKEDKMPISIPLFMIGFKDNPNKEQKVKRHIAIEILLNILIGKSSKLYQELYDEGLVTTRPDTGYEFSKNYAHVTIMGQSKDPKKVEEMFLKQLKEIKNNGIDDNDFKRAKRKIYGDYVIEYNDVGDIARIFLSDYMKGVQSFDYIEDFDTVNKQYVEQMLKEVFDEEKMVMSVVNCG